MQVGLDRKVIKGVSYGHAAKKVSSPWQRLADHLGFCPRLPEKFSLWPGATGTK